MSTAVHIAKTLWPNRELDRYPRTGARARYLAIVTLVSTVIFYQIYVQGSVSTAIIADFQISLGTFVLTSIFGNAVGALAAYATGIADRLGRANLIVSGTAMAALVTALGLPNAPNAAVYIALYTLVSLVGGVVLVATPTLVRDFSPQVGRATAMAIWTLGPVLGNLVISVVTHLTSPSHPDWQFQFYVSGAVGAVTCIVAFFGLRELSPGIRNQVMTTLKERESVEARAATTKASDATGIGSMWRRTLIIPALGISLFLMFYVTRVGFFVLYFVSNFGYSISKANGLATWYWVANLIALVLTGVLSDRVGRRRPFMVSGALISIVALALFAQRATQPDTSYRTFVVLLVLLAIGGAMANCAWLTLFSESVEKIDPSAVARGMAVYGSVLRASVTVILVGFLVVVSAPGTLVNHGQRVAAITQQYDEQFATLGKVPGEVVSELRGDPGDVDARTSALAALSSLDLVTVRAYMENPSNPGVARAQLDGAQAALDSALDVPVEDVVYVYSHGEDVASAVKDAPSQWERWWWICLVGQVLLVPLSFGMRGAGRLRKS